MHKRSFEPFPTLCAAGLTLRELHDSDHDVFFTLRSDPQVLRYLANRALQTPQQAAEKLASLLSGQREGRWVIWGLCHPGDETLMGTVCLWNFDEENAGAELGYDLLPDFWGAGYMTEAVRLVLDYGFETLALRYVAAFTHPQNAPSRRLLERQGFLFTGMEEEQALQEHEPYAIYRLERPQVMQKQN